MNKSDYIDLLRALIAIPSHSKEEDISAECIMHFLDTHGIKSTRYHNNIVARNNHFVEGLPTLLLNSHHDTVKPNAGYTRNPYSPSIEDNILYGLGSNDAGASLISLMSAFIELYHEHLPFNIVFAATAEEEISGLNGIECILPMLGPIDFGIVGEPTGMNVAIAERGLLVLDCTTKGIASHAAYSSKENALYKAIEDIAVLREHEFEYDCAYLGKSTLNVTMIHAGTQHNVIPDTCTYTIDIRTNATESYENIISMFANKLHAQIQPRSLRLKPSVLSSDNILYKTAQALQLTTFASQTMSDQALMPFPTIKMGPGDSTRSHTANEFIILDEIYEGIDTYIHFLSTLRELL